MILSTGQARHPPVPFQVTSRPVSENCFHDLNSQNKFSLHRQNKISNCVHILFYFCEWRNNSCKTYQFLTFFFDRTVFTPSMSVQCACRTLCFPAPAPVQMSFRLEMLILEMHYTRNADKKCSFFTVKNFTEQKFQVHEHWEMGHFSEPAPGFPTTQEPDPSVSVPTNPSPLPPR